MRKYLGRWTRFWQWLSVTRQSLWQRAFAHQRPSSKKKRRTPSPRRRNSYRTIETLEPRHMMSVSSAFDIDTHTLHIRSDAAYETVQVGKDWSQLSGGTGTPFVTVNGIAALVGSANTPLATMDVARIEVSSSTGHNVIDLRQVDPPGEFQSGLQIAVDATGGDNTILGSRFTESIHFSGGHNRIDGGGGNDDLHGEGAADTFVFDNSGSANATNSVGDHVTIYDMGLGNTLDFSHLVNGVTVDLTNHVASGTGFSITLQPNASISNVIGSQGDDLLIGDNTDNTLDGGPGRDTLIGKEGSDTLVGGSSLDASGKVSDDGQVDVLYGDDANHPTGYSGTDLFRAGSGDQTFGNGTLDLGDNGLYVTYAAGQEADTYNRLMELVRNGANHFAVGTTSGGVSGIVSTVATANPSLFALGVYDNAVLVAAGHGIVGVPTNTVIVKLTYAGDTNGDGVVNIDDYQVIDQNVGNPLASGYMNGDTNYDGVVNIDDYQVIDQNIGNPLANPGLVGGAVPPVSTSSNTTITSGAFFGAFGSGAAATLATSFSSVSGNVLVNNPSLDGSSTSDTQSETSLIQFGSTVLVSYNDSHSNVVNSSKFTGYSRSTDGGVTFTDMGELPTNASFGDAGDPVFARDSVSGMIYLATLGFTNSNAIPVFRSTDGGATFLAPVNSAPSITGGSLDKEWIAVDNFSGTGQGNVYLVVRDFGTTQGIRFFRSTDQGATWTPSAGTLLTTATTVQGAYVAVAPDHSICTFWLDQTSGSKILMRRSTDLGATFSAAVTVATLTVTASNGDLGFSFRSSAFPSVAINPVSGQIYVAYADKGTGADRANIYMVQSTNNGVSWSAPLKINDDTTTNDQWQPAISVKPNGSQLFIGFYDRRNDAANTLIDTYGAIGSVNTSTGVITWQANQRITTTSFGVVVGVDPKINTTYMGDYDTSAADNGGFYYAWADNRDASVGRVGNQANVRFAKIATDLQVVSNTPASGAVLSTPPVDFTLVFTDAYDPASVQATDLTVNGIAADSFVLVDSTTLRFHYNTSPITSQGLQTVVMSAGAITRLSDANALIAFSSSFRYDLTPMQVVSTSPANGSSVTLPLTTIDINLNEAVDPTSVSVSDLTLNQGSVTAVAVVGGTTVRFTIAGVTTEGTLSLSLAAGALTDVFGNASLAYSGSLILDVGTVPFTTPLTDTLPQGSRIYSGSVATNSISFVGDTDSYTLTIDAGQTLAIFVHPTVTGLQPTIELRNSTNGLVGTATSAAAGQDVVLQNLGVLAAGQYTMIVSGAASTTGAYTLNATLNAMLESEAHNGTSNDTIATAQSLNSGFISDGGAATQVAILGSGASAGTAAVFSADFESGNNGFVINNGTTGLWHNSIGRGSQAGHTATHSLYYGQAETAAGGGNYSTGATNTGNVTSPSIVLPSGVSALTLDFNYVLQTEGSTSFDLAQLQISTNGGTTFTTLASYNGTAESTVWKAATQVSLASYAGQTVQLRWLFNTVDATANAFEGWYLDDVKIQTVASASDVYSVTLAAGDTATFAAKVLTTGSVTFNIQNAASVVLANSATGAVNVDRTITDFVAPSAGTYYVVVTAGSTTDYSLLVTKNAEFDTENNDTTATAQVVNSRSVAGDQRIVGDIGGTANSLLRFDEVTSQPVDGLSINGMTFGFELDGQPSDDAIFGASRVDESALQDGFILEGNAAGILTVNFATPANHVSFDFSLLTPDGQPVDRSLPPYKTTSPPPTGESEGDGIFVRLYDLAGNLIENRTVAPFNPQADAFSEASFNYDGPAIGSIQIDFHHDPDIRFGIDNLSVLSNNNIDYYKVNLNAGTAVTFSTTTPGDGAGEFVNTFNPRIRILNSTGTQVALDDNSAADGRNALLSYTPTTGGVYYVEISSTTVSTTIGEYVLDISGAVAPAPTFTVASITPANGSQLVAQPLTVTVVFNDAILLTTLSASDLTVDGIAATAVSTTTDRTAVFTISSSLAQGTHTIALAAGSITSIQAANLGGFSSTFTLDTIAPRIIASSVAAGALLSAGNLSYVVTFSEAMKTANLDATDFTLLGIDKNVSYTATSFSYNGAGTILTINFTNLAEDRYTLTLLSADTRFEDVSGNDLDGEAGAFPTGNGVAGGNFVLNFSTDNATLAMPAMTGALPAGSLIYASTTTTDITTAADTDSVTLYLDAGQTVSIVAHPNSSWTPTVSLLSPTSTILGTVTAAAAGQEAVLQTISTTTAGTYTITASGSGGTFGVVSIQATLNAAVESESHNGTSNNASATAQNIDSSFKTLVGTASRAGVVGTSDIVAGSLPTEIESNDTIATANNAVANFTAYSGNLYHLGIKGTISLSTDTADYYKIGTLDVGDIITISLSGSTSLRGTLVDSYVYLYRGTASSPVLVTSDDDSGPGLESLIYRFTITTADTYYIDAAPFSSSYTGTYDLGVYLENTGTAPTTGGSVTTETESNNTAATANDVSISWRASQYLSRTAGTISATTDIDTYQYTFNAGDLITINAHSTSTLHPKITLFNSAGTSIALEDGSSSGPTVDSFLYSYRIVTTGTYYMQVASFSGTGAYNADIYLTSTIAPPTPSTPEDWYSFSLTAGDTTTIGLKGITSSSAVLELKNAAGTTLVTGATSSGGLDKLISNFTATTTGTYYIRVTGGTGNYDVVATKNAAFDNQVNSTLATAQPISTTGTVLGAISAASSDYYSVTLTAGTALRVTTTTPGGTALQGINALDPKLEIYDSTGTLLLADDNSAGDGKNALVNFTVLTSGTYKIRVLGGGNGDYTLSTSLVAPASVTQRALFYNNSAFDGNNIAANAADDAAIATDKTALLPGGTGSFANYSSYSRGINGIMIDVAGLSGTPTAADFVFRVGNNNNPNGWVTAAAPTITVRKGAGVGGSDRVVLTWADGTIVNQWLQITVKASLRTGLLTDDVFYFGNAIGETGNSTGNTFVNATDEIMARNQANGSVGVTSAYDFDRNGIVDSADEMIARANRTTFVNALNLFTVP